jgi:L-threonylcarbamoyladenylate synthase
MIEVPVERGILSASSLQHCIDVLRKGEVICYPTETFYALGVDAMNEQALLRLYALKQRPFEKELPLIASDIAMVASFCDTADSRFATLAKKFWPGPLTIVIPGTDRSKTYAIRVSSHPVARQLAQAFGSPLISTSANRSGEQPVLESDLLPESIKRDVSVIVQGGSTPGGLPSTIVSLLERPGIVIREGAIPLSEIVSFI